MLKYIKYLADFFGQLKVCYFWKLTIICYSLWPQLNRISYIKEAHLPSHICSLPEEIMKLCTEVDQHQKNNSAMETRDMTTDTVIILDFFRVSTKNIKMARIMKDTTLLV